MNSFELDLNKCFQRPVVKLGGFNNFNALLDTGSVFPVWTTSEDVLKSIGGVCVKQSCIFGGFGGNVDGKLYTIPMLKVGDFVYPNMHIILYSELEDINFDLILSATMFNGLRYEINNIDNKFKVYYKNEQDRIRNIVIKGSNKNIKIFTSLGNAECSSLSENKFCNKKNITADLAASFNDYVSNK